MNDDQTIKQDNTQITTVDEATPVVEEKPTEHNDVTLSDSEESVEICKMTEKGSGHQSELSLISRTKNGIFGDLWAFLTILLNK